MYIFSLDINTISCTIKSQADIISRNIKDKGVKIGTLYAKKAETGLVVTYKKLLFNTVNCCLAFLMKKVNIVAINYFIIF